jgi:hypothetical protein
MKKHLLKNTTISIRKSNLLNGKRFSGILFTMPGSELVERGICDLFLFPIKSHALKWSDGKPVKEHRKKFGTTRTGLLIDQYFNSQILLV